MSKRFLLGFLVAVVFCAPSYAQWTWDSNGYIVPLAGSNSLMKFPGSAVFGGNAAPTSSALEVRTSTFNYNTVFGVKTSDYNSTTNTGSMLTIAMNTNAGNAVSFLQAYTNGPASVGPMVLNYLGGSVGIGPFNVYAVPAQVPLYTLDVHGTGHTSGDVTLDGNVGIGTAPPTSVYKIVVNGAGHFTGQLDVDGNIAAKYQDVAEWVPVSEPLTPGTVVVLSPDDANHVIPSTKGYDTSVAGVVSAQPGLALGVAGDDKALIATTGRVRVKVDARHDAIKIGDLLVTGEAAGTAMKSRPVNAGGVRLHRPGTVLGKALEPLSGGTGEILVLLTLQ
jgi:hypothetical protein